MGSRVFLLKKSSMCLIEILITINHTKIAQNQSILMFLLGLNLFSIRKLYNLYAAGVSVVLKP